MNILLYIALGLLGLIIVIRLILMFMPSVVSVSRQVKIDADIDDVFELVNNLKNWERWSAWYFSDPNQKIIYSEPAVGEGAYYEWDSDKKNVGKGKLTLTDVERNKQIGQKLQFEKWGDNKSVMLFTELEDGKVEVEFKMENEFKGFSKFFAGTMKKMLGNQFEESLAWIKSEAEKEQ